MTMMNGPHNGIAMRLPSQAWQDFGDVNTGHASGNGLEQPADRVGRLGFHVPEVNMTRSAAVEDHNDRLRLTFAATGSGCLGTQPISPEKAQRSPSTSLEELPARGLADRWCREITMSRT